MRYPVDCPYCGLTFDDNAEYVDVGVGGRGVQVTGNRCDRCGASEVGGYKTSDQLAIAFGWFPPAARWYAPEGCEWLDDLIGRVFDEGVRHGYRHRTGAPADSLAPTMTFAPQAPTGVESPF